MADKEKLKGGIASLFGGATQSVARPTERRSEETTSNDEAKIVEATQQEEIDLINSVEDQELRTLLEERLNQKRKVGRGRPRKNDINGKRSDGYDRTSLIIPVNKWAKVKEIAFIETLTLKEIVELALDLVIERYESKHGEVTPQPERTKKDINEIF